MADVILASTFRLTHFPLIASASTAMTRGDFLISNDLQMQNKYDVRLER